MMSPMRCVPLTEGPDFRERVIRWLRHRDLNFADSGHRWSAGIEIPSGMVSDTSWVVFLRSQVVLVVPDEVHTCWHRGVGPGSPTHAWLVEDSTWLPTFA